MQPGSPRPLTGVQPRAGSWFSESSSLSVWLSQLMWKRVTRGLAAKMFRWSWGGVETCHCHFLGARTPCLLRAPTSFPPGQTKQTGSPRAREGLRVLPVRKALICETGVEKESRHGGSWGPRSPPWMMAAAHPSLPRARAVKAQVLELLLLQPPALLEWEIRAGTLPPLGVLLHLMRGSSPRWPANPARGLP